MPPTAFDWLCQFTPRSGSIYGRKKNNYAALRAYFHFSIFLSYLPFIEYHALSSSPPSSKHTQPFILHETLHIFISIILRPFQGHIMFHGLYCFDAAAKISIIKMATADHHMDVAALISCFHLKHHEYFTPFSLQRRLPDYFHGLFIFAFSRYDAFPLRLLLPPPPVTQKLSLPYAIRATGWIYISLRLKCLCRRLPIVIAIAYNWWLSLDDDVGWFWYFLWGLKGERRRLKDTRCWLTLIFFHLFQCSIYFPAFIILNIIRFSL